MYTPSPLSGRVLDAVGRLWLDRTAARRRIDRVLGQEAPQTETAILEDTILALRAQVNTLQAQIDTQAEEGQALVQLATLVEGLRLDDAPRRAAIERARAYLRRRGILE